MSIVCFTIEVEPATISRNKIKANWGSRKDYPLFLFIKLNTKNEKKYTFA